MAETESWHSRSINQRNPPGTTGPGPGLQHMALTFGTLLSSQGADAHDPRPIPWPSFAAVSPLYTGLRSSLTTRARPAVSQTLPGPVRSRSVHEEPYTHIPR